MTEDFVSRLEKEIANRKPDLLHIRGIAERADPDGEKMRCMEKSPGTPTRNPGSAILQKEIDNSDNINGSH